MNTRNWIELGMFLTILVLSAKPLGIYLDHVYEGNAPWLGRIFGPFERFIYRVLGVDPEEDQHWTRYAFALLGVSVVGFLFTYVILRIQNILPLNPAGFGVLPPHLALNTAVSFLTNTNWQSYGGESTMSYFSQMVALTFHNFTSAAVGVAVAVALIRGISRKEGTGIGNFWADFVRGILYVFLPMSIVLAVILISQGMIQNFHPYVEATTIEGAKQVIAQGPVASQVAIKMLGTNGGGFFNANAAHPYENPNAISNFLQMLAIFIIPSALVYLLGRKTRSLRHGWSVWIVMAILFVGGTLVCAHFEYQGVDSVAAAGCKTGQMWEGKESRFGIFDSAMFATVTTDASCGAVNAMHDSFTPMGGFIPLLNMKLGEIVFGGVGAGLYGMMSFILLTVFIAGLMVGRTPEYLGKKIGGREVKYVMLSMITMALLILGLTSWGVLDARGTAGMNNPGSHGFTEILYAYTSATANNGSAFAGLSANVPFWNLTLAIAMFFGRFFIMIPMLAVAGSLVRKKIHPSGEASFPVHGPIFIGLLLGVILLVGALTFFPVLTLGPVAEQLK